MTTVEIREIPSCPGYGASSDGRIWSYKTEKFMKGCVRTGNVRVNLSINGWSLSRLVRRLVFEAFHGYVPEVVVNNDGNRLNNNLDNLKEIRSHKLNNKKIGRPKSDNYYALYDCTHSDSLLFIGTYDEIANYLGCSRRRVQNMATPSERVRPNKRKELILIKD